MAQTTPVHSGYTIINGTSTGKNGSKINTWIEYNVTQSEQNKLDNKSVLNVYLYARANTSGLSTAWQYNNTYGSITVNGTTYSGPALANGYDFRATNIYNLMSYRTSIEVSHNSDGTKSISISGTWDKGTSSSTYVTGGSVASTTVTLPTIPRASSISSLSVNAGATGTITVSKANSSFYHTITYNFQGLTGTICDHSSATSVSFTATPSTFLPKITGTSATGTLYCKTYASATSTTQIGDTKTSTLTISIPKATLSGNVTGTIGSSKTLSITKVNDSSISTAITYTFVNSSTITFYSRGTATSATHTFDNTLAQQIPKATSGTGTITITTYHTIGSTVYNLGNNSYTLTLSVPSTMVPTASFAFTKVYNGTTAQNQTLTSWNKWVQGYTKIQVRLTGTGVQGSTITSLAISGTGISASGTTSPLTATSSGSITATSVTYTGTVVDSRGKTGSVPTAQRTQTFEAYSQPTASSVDIHRCNAQGAVDTAGEHVYVKYVQSYSTVGGSNTCTVKLQYKLSTASNWTTYGTALQNNTANVITALTLSTANNYNARLQITDGLNTVYTNSFTLPTEARILNVNPSGSGVAIGGFSTDAGKLQVYYPADFEGNTLPTINNLPFVAEAKGFALYGGTVIPNNSNLNDDIFMDAGSWYCENNADAQTLSNCPTNYAFRMIVLKTLKHLRTEGNGTNWIGSQQIIYDYMGNVYSRYIYYADTDTDKRIGVWYGGLKDNITVGNLGWDGRRANGVNIPTLNTLAFWNGAYSGTTSNLEYFGSNALNNLTNHGTFSGSNANDCLTLGVWLINPSTTTTNLPYSDWGFLRVERQGNNYIQTFFRLYGQNTFVRIYANGDWRGWRELGNGVDGGTYNYVTATGSNVTLTGSTANDLCTLTVPHRDVWLVEGYCKVTATASANTKVELYLNNYWSNHRVGAWIPYTNTPLYMQYNHVAWGTDISSAIHLALWHSADVSVSDILLRFYKIQSTALT